MTDTTNPVDGDAMPEVVDDLLIENDDALESAETTQDDDEADQHEDDEGDEDAPEDDLEDVEWEGQAFKAPKGIREALLRQDDYTKKTQAVAEQRKAVEQQQMSVQQMQERQAAFAQDIAELGALNAKLAPYTQVPDWPAYLRTGGAEAQAHWAEYQALAAQRDSFTRDLTGRIHQRAEQDRQAQQQAIEAGRAELAKHIKGYGPDTLSKMEQFAAPFGFSPEEIRDAEADPRSLRLLHLAMVGQQALQQQKKTSTLSQASKARPVNTLRGSGGRFEPAPERMGPAQMAKHLGY